MAITNHFLMIRLYYRVLCTCYLHHVAENLVQISCSTVLENYLTLGSKVNFAFVYFS